MKRVWTLLLLASCMDKAKADYDRCVERDQNYDVKGAVAACQAAVAADSKSPSGLAAAKKLLDLDRVADKLKAEQDEKTQREATIKKDDPPLVVVHSAAATTANVPPPAAINQENAMVAGGDSAGARALIMQHVTDGSATKEEGKLLKDICTQQKDKACLKLVSKLKL